MHPLLQFTVRRFRNSDSVRYQTIRKSFKHIWISTANRADYMVIANVRSSISNAVAQLMSTTDSYHERIFARNKRNDNRAKEERHHPLPDRYDLGNWLRCDIERGNT